MQRNFAQAFRFGLGLAFLFAAAAHVRAAGWQMKHRDPAHTGRADFTVPPERLNSTFFNVFSWQKRVPGSPTDGSIGSSSMVFVDGAGPGGADVVVAGYHWPKGVQAMDRHTGRLLWNGNPSGGETIGDSTPAFSNNGASIYVLNDATNDATWPNGHPLMAFATTTGPATFRHNGANPNPGHLSSHSPTIAADGRIFLHAWVDRPYGATDTGLALPETWAAATATDIGLGDPTLYQNGATLTIVAGGRSGVVRAYSGATGAQLWSIATPTIDAVATIDPASGNIYIPAGSDDIYVVGLNISGAPLWAGGAARLVFDYVSGSNNPQRAQSGGCLSHDGATFYFQTNSQQGDGRLYAVNTADGSLKWSFNTASRGWEMIASSPIVTPNGVIIVGNNDGDAYYAVHDDGPSASLLDTFAIDSAGTARATPALSPDGRLYLPLRTVWTTSNGDGDIPSGAVENLFCGFDVTANPSIILPPPSNQTAVALNHAVTVSWRAISDPNGQFDHYAIYRATAPFTSVASMSPVGTVASINTIAYTDSTALNGAHYYYAVTSVAIGGGQQTTVASIGPRTPRDETDLQIIAMARTPRYPRYDPIYSGYTITEPSGFGPYFFTAATGLGSGQNASTQRWPNIGDPVTYTATVRNRGTNPWTASIPGTWQVDGVTVSQPTSSGTLNPNGTRTFALVRTWDGLSHQISFALNLSDARSSNNTFVIDTKSVAFLSYMDRTKLEDFREETASYPQAATDDYLDWLNRCMARFNAMFQAAGCPKRVHFDILQVLNDSDPDPAINRLPFAIFPFRYYATDGSLRQSGYYSPADDIDFGLLHEMGHQLGLIDLYQFDLAPENNQVSGLPYSTVACLMHGVSPFLSQHSALGMTHWLDKAHGYYGQYMYDMPATIRMRFIGQDGQPLQNATVSLYQLAERPGVGKLITNQAKAQGTTDANGLWTLPNVHINTALVPTTFAGDTLRDNPFGYLAVVGTNALLHFKVEHQGFTDFAWLDVTECNNAYRNGQTATATFDRTMRLGGTIQHYPPLDMAELNASSWTGWAQGGTATLSDDTTRKIAGLGSVRFVTDGGFDTSARYPGDRLAQWNLSGINSIRVWCYAVNNNIGFQNGSPWVRLGNQNGYFEWRSTNDALNLARNVWREFVIPVAGNSQWQYTVFGSPDLSQINYFEIHADTWGAGFTLWIDGVRFEPSPRPPQGDMNCDGSVSAADVPGFVLALLDPAAYAAAYPLCDASLADMNTDGQQDASDTQTFVSLLP